MLRMLCPHTATPAAVRSRIAALALAVVFQPWACAADEADAATPPSLDYIARFQSTLVWQRHGAFHAAYSGPNSLSEGAESRSYTLTATAFLGARLWPGGEVYFNPEMTSSRSLSELHGLGALTNGENQKGGGTQPQFYRARTFLRQTWNVGGGSEPVEAAANQLAGRVDKQRVVLSVGTLSLGDIFDGNAYSHDPRSQFLNWTMMALGAFDYAADTRGYTTGAAVEAYQDDWVVRLGRFMQPKESNGLPLDGDLLHHYGDQLELEHGHELAGRAGKVRLLVFRNRAVMGSFQDAVNAWRAGGSAGVPSVADVRRLQTKQGWGLGLEQAVSDDVGLFLRASAADGRTETYAFTEVERSVSGGLSIKGASWQRADDVLGLGLVQNGLSKAHRQYLAAGGLGAFIGDGAPPTGLAYRYAPERAFEAYYNAAIGKALWLSGDVQRVSGPAYNAGRGPVTILGLRVHAER